MLNLSWIICHRVKFCWRCEFFATPSRWKRCMSDDHIWLRTRFPSPPFAFLLQSNWTNSYLSALFSSLNLFSCWCSYFHICFHIFVFVFLQSNWTASYLSAEYCLKSHIKCLPNKKKLNSINAKRNIKESIFFFIVLDL